MRRWMWPIIGLVALILLGIGAYALWRTGALEELRAVPATVTFAGTSEASLDADDAPYAQSRQRMVDSTIRARGVSDPEVLRAMETVPRHRFVPASYVGQAYADHPLPIGHGQTISQPYIVALMTELTNLQPEERVLEIGTGSGYQAAVLADIVDEVYTMEIIPELATSAAERLSALAYENVHTRQGDGYFGWPEQAPFDAIVVTCAPDHVPQPLVDQLAEGGRLVVPIGPPGGYQTLWQYVLEEDGLRAYNIGGVRFVPLLREAPE